MISLTMALFAVSSLMQAQDMHPKFSELHSMQRFTEIISNHSIGRTELDRNMAFLHLVSDIEISMCRDLFPALDRPFVSILIAL